MRINTNIAALNAYRNLTNTDNRLNKSLERLSSGLRINRASDDAAGLAISEKMRAQVRGLNQAMRNAQDGISLIQTAEGALNETHSILQRMRELAVQAANDTYTANDRMEIQREIDQLRDEIDRIANTTEFNTKKLLDGSTAALTSTDKLTTQVFMRDGLRVTDQFGQKAVGGGNYKLEIVATPGTAQVQKTDIMKIKHDLSAGEISNFVVVQPSQVAAEVLGIYQLKFGGDQPTANNTITIGTKEFTFGSGTDQVAIGGSLNETIGNLATAIEGSSLGTRFSVEVSETTITLTEKTGQATGVGLGAPTISADSALTVTYTQVRESVKAETLQVGEYSFTIGKNPAANETITIAGEVFTFTDDATHAGIELGTHVLIGDDEAATATNLRAAIDLNATLSARFENAGGTGATITLKEEAGAATGIDITAPVITGSKIGDIARLTTSIKDIDRFWDASGNFLVEDPQTITLVQGNGNKTSFTIFGTDTIADIRNKLNEAIAKGLGQEEIVGAENADKFVSYVTEPADDGAESVAGTFVIRSAVAGSPGEINFIGDEALINALSLTTIQEARENQFTVNVTDAHSGDVVAENVTISGNTLVGVVHKNVDVRFDNNTAIEVTWDDTSKAFTLNAAAEAAKTFVHLADNTAVFQIGANPLQDVSASIGDMSAAALGVDNILVTSRELANRAITQIDGALDRVSAERSKMGALQNRLEHTIANLGVAAENLTAAESRIRDLDMAAEMMEFTKQQIMQQAGTAMLAQANLKPQTVLQLLG